MTAVTSLNNEFNSHKKIRETAWRDYLDRIRSSDPDAMAALYDQSSALVFGIAQRLLESRADAEEVALDVYMQVWRGARSYDSSRGSVSSWLIIMARSRALDRIRSRATQTRWEQPWDAGAGWEPVVPGFEKRSLLALDCRRIATALSGLPEEQRQAIELAFYQGYSHAELAGRLDVPLGTVKTRIRQGIIRLRHMLAFRTAACRIAPPLAGKP